MVKITALMENHSENPELISENGLSLFIESGSRRILFDLGGSGAFIDNARLLGVAPDAADTVIVSHGHCDHAGGFVRYGTLFRNGYTLYIHCRAFSGRYWNCAAEGALIPTSAGIDAHLLQRMGVRWRAVASPVTPLGDGLILLGDIPRVVSFEPADPSDVILTDSGAVTDPYLDELVLSIALEDGQLLISGCSHAGVANIVTEAERRLGKPVTGIIGGAHLLPCGDERISDTVDFINGSHIRAAVLGHCTGQRAMDIMAASCPAFRPLVCGGIYTFS